MSVHDARRGVKAQESRGIRVDINSDRDRLSHGTEARKRSGSVIPGKKGSICPVPSPAESASHADSCEAGLPLFSVLVPAPPGSPPRLLQRPGPPGTHTTPSASLRSTPLSVPATASAGAPASPGSAQEGVPHAGPSHSPCQNPRNTGPGWLRECTPEREACPLPVACGGHFSAEPRHLKGSVPTTPHRARTRGAPRRDRRRLLLGIWGLQGQHVTAMPPPATPLFLSPK